MPKRADKATGKSTLKHRGQSRKQQGNPGTKAYKAETEKVKPKTMKDRGPGSAFANALYRSEAARLKEESKKPGNLGYKETLPVGPQAKNKSLTKYLKKGKK